MPVSQLPAGESERLTAKGKATRAQVVQAAAALMYERGVANTSNEDIRAVAGVSNSQLYHYFADKDDLTRAVIAHQIEQVVGRHQALLSGLDSFAALTAWRDVVVGLVSQRDGQGGCPVGSLVSELADQDEQARLALVDGFARWESAIRDGIAAMRERGELRADADPEQLALAVLAALQGGLLLTQARRDSAPLQSSLDAVLGYVHSFAA
jgi:TetR/AcrR family transcriptional regulator, transcriptional repressor for nem operon